jgi:hypothetical protein
VRGTTWAVGAVPAAATSGSSAAPNDPASAARESAPPDELSPPPGTPPRQRSNRRNTPVQATRRRTGGRPSVVLMLGAVALLIVGIIGARAVAEGWLAWINEPLQRQGAGLPITFGTPQVPVVGATGASPTNAPGAAGVPPTPAPQRTTAPVASAVPTRLATATLSGQQRRVMNTEGQGVALRESPGGPRQPGRGFDEGAVVTAFETSGEWTRVRGSDGREGWVLSVTLGR